MKAVPLAWWSWNFALADGDRPLASIRTSCWRERGTLSIEGRKYRVYREGVFGGDFVLEHEGEAIARAVKPSAFRREFVVTHAGREYTLGAVSAFRRAFVLRAGDETHGTIAPDGLFRRTSTIDLPATLPMPVRAFLVWLAILIWKRDAASAGG